MILQSLKKPGLSIMGLDDDDAETGRKGDEETFYTILLTTNN
jgi:hypothetical protein